MSYDTPTIDPWAEARETSAEVRRREDEIEQRKVSDRASYYNSLIDRLLAGSYLEPEEMTLLAMGLQKDTEVMDSGLLSHDYYDLSQVLNDREQGRPGSTQAAQFEQVTADAGALGDVSSDIIAAMGVIAPTPAGKTSFGAKLYKLLWGGGKGRKVLTLGAAAYGGYELWQAGQGTQQPTTGEEEEEATPQPTASDVLGGNWQLYTPEPYWSVQAEPTGYTEEQLAIMDLSPFERMLIQEYGLDPAEVALIWQQQQDAGLTTWGDQAVTRMGMEYGITLGGEKIDQPLQYDPITGRYLDPTYTAPTGQPVPGPMLPETTDFRQAIRPGGTINPDAFAPTPDGVSMLEVASEAAERWDVPLAILYGVVNRESGWNINAVSSDGNRVGLAQIDLSQVYATPQQARDPNFSLNFLAYQIHKYMRMYGSLEAAILAILDPAAGEAYANGTFRDQYDAQYLIDVIQMARETTLLDTTFDAEGIQKMLAGLSGGGGGPTIPAYVEPDPSALRNWLKGLYEQRFKREPTDEELTQDVEMLQRQYRVSYDEQVKHLLGQPSTDVNPEEQFIEEFTERGEYKYREESAQQRSMMDYAGQIARLLGEGM